jgi:hypothetical protein
MHIEKKGHTTTIKNAQGNADAMLAKLTREHKTFEKDNLVVDLTAGAPIDIKAVKAFVALSKTHRKGKKSFVIVAPGIDFNAVPQSLVVVPTIQEAQDMIEMEEIERDLGF